MYRKKYLKYKKKYLDLKFQNGGFFDQIGAGQLNEEYYYLISNFETIRKIANRNHDLDLSEISEEYINELIEHVKKEQEWKKIDKKELKKTQGEKYLKDESTKISNNLD
ncbi:hypothetical protein Indivirus_13_7, partial [Indivirus ILV1]